MSKFTIEFGPKSSEALDQLSSRLERPKTEVVRRALDVYRDIVHAARDEGKRIVLEDPTTGEKQVLIV